MNTRISVTLYLERASYRLLASLEKRNKADTSAKNGAQVDNTLQDFVIIIMTAAATSIMINDDNNKSRIHALQMN